MLADDGKTVALKMSKPVENSELIIRGVKDRSPAGNAIANRSVPLAALSPVWLQTDETQEATVDSLPVNGSDPWTINLMLRIDKQPPNRTLIAGFGALEDTAGHARYFAKFA